MDSARVEKEKEENFNLLMDSSVERTRDPLLPDENPFLKTLCNLH